MASTLQVVQPPFYDAPIVDYASGQQHSQAWTEYHQNVADRLAGLQARRGITNGTDAAPGEIGEYLSSVSATSVGMSTGTIADIASLPLPPGDWDVEGNVVFDPTGAVTFVAASVNTVSVTFGSHSTANAGTLGTAQQHRIGTGGATRVNIDAPMTAYLVAQALFSTGAMNATGTIWARRAR
jgi:hypothetical protein